MKKTKTEETVGTVAAEEETEKYEDSLTYRVLRQDLEFERTGENRITRARVTRARANRILRLLKRKVVVLTVTRGRRVIIKGYVNGEGLRTMIDGLSEKYKLDITYSALREVKIVLKELYESWEERTAG